MDVDPDSILTFWFSEAVRPYWFRSTAALDEQIRAQYLSLWEAARRGELDAWEATPEGVLALVILLDQFPLNMFRDQPTGFATEARSREVAQRAIERGLDQQLSDDGRRFIYMPFMHSEDPGDQERAVALFAAAGLSDNLKWARHHRDIIRRFGRFPHRNAILGRPSTADEQAYLDSPEAFQG